MSKKKPFYKFWWFWVIVVLVFLFCVGAVSKSQKAPEKGQEEPEQTVNKEPTNLQKCTVMEAADLYNTGATNETSVAFEKAKNSCKEWKTSWGEEQFDEVVEMDWKERQNEQINGKQLTEYLEEVK